MAKKEFKNFQDFLERTGFDYHHLSVTPNGGGFPLISLETSPTEFLLQAEKDFTAEDKAFYLNSITNSKRAILCQMDQVLISFGFNSLRWNVVKKIAYLNKLGIITPPVLRKISKVRNLLEHEYIKPSREDVELALDISTLFVLSNKALFSVYEASLTFGLDASGIDSRGDFVSYISTELMRNKNVFWQVYAHIENKLVARWKMPQTDPFFCSLVKLCTAFQLGFKIDDAFDELNQLHERFKNAN